MIQKAVDLVMGRWRLIAVAAAVLVAVFVLGRCTGADAERDRQAARELKVERKASASNEVAAGERLNDAGKVDAQKKGETDAVASIPDARPSARRRSVHCQRMRDYYGPTDRRVPAECR